MESGGLRLMAEPMSQGFDQTCGDCQGLRYKVVERAATYGDNPQVHTVQDTVTCPTCQGAGRIGGQSQ